MIRQVLDDSLHVLLLQLVKLQLLALGVNLLGLRTLDHNLLASLRVFNRLCIHVNQLLRLSDLLFEELGALDFQVFLHSVDFGEGKHEALGAGHVLDREKSFV